MKNRSCSEGKFMFRRKVHEESFMFIKESSNSEEPFMFMETFMLKNC